MKLTKLTSAQLLFLFSCALSANDKGEFAQSTWGTNNKRPFAMLDKLTQAGCVYGDNSGHADLDDYLTWYRLTERAWEILGSPKHVIKADTLRWEFSPSGRYGTWTAVRGKFEYQISFSYGGWEARTQEKGKPYSPKFASTLTLASAKRVVLGHVKTGQWTHATKGDTGEDTLEQEDMPADEEAEAAMLALGSDLVWVARNDWQVETTVAHVEGWDYRVYVFGLKSDVPKWQAACVVSPWQPPFDRTDCAIKWTTKEPAMAACVYHRAHGKWPRRKLGPEEWLERNYRRRYDP